MVKKLNKINIDYLFTEISVRYIDDLMNISTYEQLVILYTEGS